MSFTFLGGLWEKCLLGFFHWEISVWFCFGLFCFVFCCWGFFLSLGLRKRLSKIFLLCFIANRASNSCLWCPYIAPGTCSFNGIMPFDPQSHQLCCLPCHIRMTVGMILGIGDQILLCHLPRLPLHWQIERWGVPMSLSGADSWQSAVAPETTPGTRAGFNVGSSGKMPQPDI